MMNNSITLVDFMRNDGGLETKLLYADNFCIGRHLDPTIRYMTFDEEKTLDTDSEKKVFKDGIMQSLLCCNYHDITGKHNGQYSELRFGEIRDLYNKNHDIAESMSAATFYNPFGSKDKASMITASITDLFLVGLPSFVYLHTGSLHTAALTTITLIAGSEASRRTRENRAEKVLDDAKHEIRSYFALEENVRDANIEFIKPKGAIREVAEFKRTNSHPTRKDYGFLNESLKIIYGLK